MLKRIVVLLFFVQVSFGQTKDGVELCLEYQKIVSGFTSEKEANEALDKILNVIGASKNFTLIPCDNINNALAITFKGDRYILFDNEFMNQITQLTNNWSSIFILAHEVGHHINGHTREALMISVLDDLTLEKKREEELEADEFASFILAKLGASIDDINAGIELITTNDDDTYSTHPSQDKRLAAIRTGYERAESTIISNKVNKQYDYVEPERVVNSNWEYYDVTLEQHIQWLNKTRLDLGREIIKDPFEKKEIEKTTPLLARNVSAKGKSIDGNKEITLELVLEKWKDPSYNTRNGYNIDIFFRDYDEAPKISFDKNLVEDFPEYNFEYIDIKPGLLYGKIGYIIDDFEGFFISNIPSWIEDAREYLTYDFTTDPWTPLDKNKNFGKPRMRMESFYISTLNNSYDEIKNFVKLLRDGNKLYIKLVELQDYDGNRLEHKYQNLIPETVYVFNLKGSFKTLNFLGIFKP